VISIERLEVEKEEKMIEEIVIERVY